MRTFEGEETHNPAAPAGGGGDARSAPTVSVGIPVFNGEAFLNEALGSVCAQTFPDLEVIISDNGSTDGTAAICQDFAASDPRVRYVRHAVNRGAAWNYNHVFSLSRGRYFKWASDDDVCRPTMLQHCVHALEADPRAVLAYGASQIIDDQGAYVTDYPPGPDVTSPSAVRRFEALVTAGRGKWHAIFGVMRRDVLAGTPLIGSFLDTDGCLLAELALHGSFVQIPEVLFLRRVHKGNAYMKRSVDAWREFYDPTAPRRRAMPTWRRTVEYARAVRRAPLGFGQKTSALGFLGRRVFNDVVFGKHAHVKEAMGALRIPRRAEHPS